jgi:hypothetical protein
MAIIKNTTTNVAENKGAKKPSYTVGGNIS